MNIRKSIRKIRKSIRKRVERLSLSVYKAFAPEPLERYSHVISLGFNCEIAYQLFKYYGYVEASLFNWCAVFGSKNLVAALKSLDTVGVEFEPHPGSFMWKDVNHPIYFHGRGGHAIWAADADPALLQEDKTELISRLVHLREKFKGLAASDDRILFAYKPAEAELKDVQSLVAFGIEVRNALRDMGMKNFDLLLIVTTDVNAAAVERLAELEPESNIIIDHIAFQAPIANVTGGMCDLSGWRRLWNCYRTTYKPRKRRNKYKFEFS